MNTINNFKLNTTRFSNKKTNANTPSESLSKLLHLGEAMIENKKFDIKHYLNTAETEFNTKNVKKQKFKNVVNYSTDFLNYNNNKSINVSAYTNNNFYNNSTSPNYKFRTDSFNDTKNNSSIRSNLDNKMPNINLYTYSMDKSKETKTTINLDNKMPKIKQTYLNTFSNYNYSNLKTKNNKSKVSERYNNMFDENKNAIKIINNEENNDLYKQYQYEDYNDEEDKKLFKIEKFVKKIRKNKNKNKSYDFNKYLEKAKNIYDKKNLLIAIDSDLVLNNYKSKKKKLKDIDVPIFTFITENKEISIKNLLIKLINKESNTLMKKEKKLTLDLKNNQSNIEDEEKKFEEYSDLQKSECKKIEMILTQIQKKNRDLMGEEKKMKLEVKLREYEIYKILIQMNLFRFYAKFCNQILDGDATRFEKPILSDTVEFDKINFEPIIKEVIDNYSDMKKFDSRKEKNYSSKLVKYYKEEGYFLYDPELIYHKYNEMEGNILRILQTKEKLLLKLKKRQEQNHEALSYLIDRCKILQQEYDELLQEYKENNRKFESYVKNNGSTHINVNIHEKNNLIKDLYMNVIDEFEPTIPIINKMNKREFTLINRKELVHFDEIVEYGQKILENIEINLNCLLIKMRNDEKNDKKIFDKVIYGIKNDYKLMRQSLFFKNRKEKEIMNKNKILEKAKKIVLISKKSEPPYYSNKINKKIEIDYDLIKREEDRELMSYH